MSKTRNERKRDFFENICFGIVLLGLCFAITMWLTLIACEALEHPAEQPITYAEHIARFGGESDAIQNG